MNETTVEQFSDAYAVELDHMSSTDDLTRRVYEIVVQCGETSADREDHQTEFEILGEVRITLTMNFDSTLQVFYQGSQVLLASDRFDTEGDGFISQHYEPGPWVSLIEEFCL